MASLLISTDCPQMFQQLRADTLKCDTCYWECQSEKAAPSCQARQSTFTAVPANQATILAEIDQVEQRQFLPRNSTGKVRKVGSNYHDIKDIH